MLEALRPIDSGSAVLLGHDVTKDPEYVKARIGVQPQSPAFEEKTTLAEILTYFASIYGDTVRPKQLLADVGLADKASAYPETLSGGQRQRFSIAVALVHNPQIFFLDEPTTGLDPQARHNIWELIRSVQAKGVTVVMTTHYMEEAETLCDRVAIMDNGRIIALDTPKKLINNLLKKGFKKSVTVEQASLEDVFIDLTGKELRD
jgi:ABC-2 type transport system ATP-binding protein